MTQPLLTAGVLRAKTGLPILMYHSISDDPEPGISPYFRVATSPTRFRQQMLWLRDRHYSVIDLTTALKRLQEPSRPEDRSVVITFDDGFRDFMSDAWPVLTEFGFTATVFLPTAFIGETRKSFKGRECLTWQDVRSLHRAGISFGTHTATHPVLYHLPWNDIRRELRESRIQLEDELSAPVSAFAYPYAFPQEDGEYVRRFTAELRDQGYAAAVTTAIGRPRCGSDPLVLTRLPINQMDDARLFAGKLHGAYDWMGALQSLFRRAKAMRTTNPLWTISRSSPVT
jgi:peptidoglycan/xylan/chitin deacetylase (PgdA/CDA1 family)